MGTKEKVLELHQKHPCWTGAQIGKKLSVTRQRVSQHLAKAGIRIKHKQKTRVGCLNCGKPTKNQQFCSRQCGVEYHRILVVCDNCGKEFLIVQSQLIVRNKRGKNLCCSKSCLGSMLGKKYGFGAHPENMKADSKRKYDYDSIYQKHLETGYGTIRLSRLLGINKNTVSKILYLKRHEIKE